MGSYVGSYVGSQVRSCVWDLMLDLSLPCHWLPAPMLLIRIYIQTNKVYIRIYIDKLTPGYIYIYICVCVCVYIKANTASLLCDWLLVVCVVHAIMI